MSAHEPVIGTLEHAREELRKGNLRPVIHFLCAEAGAVQKDLNAGGEAAVQARAWLDHITRELCVPGPVPVRTLPPEFLDALPRQGKRTGKGFATRLVPPWPDRSQAGG